MTVSGTVSGGGQIGPGGAVLWLRRVDGPTPRATPAQNQIITQRDKTFLPHVLAVPVGTTVQFRNDDRIYHNVFSIAKPNEFDAGIRATGATYSKTFSHAGVVELLCNIHSTMNGYVLVVDSPLYAKAQASGAFVVHGAPPAAMSCRPGTRQLPRSPASRSPWDRRGRTIWRCLSAATNDRAPSSPTSTGTSGNLS